ncbi:hypothetical protein FAI40_03530 [Acetobacteraceae bacterium]|nr:hypothetical protein FAI40_03530 [Acetobacteraceae bacterium]
MPPKIRRLLPGEIKTEMLKLIEEASEIRIAVAWAQAGHEVENALRKNPKKIKQLVVGMDFNGTDPAFLGFYHKSHLALGRATGTFHPKIYYFRNGKNAACIEGSSNFTKSAFERNAESGTLIVGHVQDEFFRKTRFLINEYAENGAKLKPSELVGYETIAAALKKQEKQQTKLAEKRRRQKEKEQKRKRKAAQKKFNTQARKKQRPQKPKLFKKPKITLPSLLFSLFFKKKSRKSFLGIRSKFLLLLAVLGALFYFHPFLKDTQNHPDSRTHHHQASLF